MIRHLVKLKKRIGKLKKRFAIKIKRFARNKRHSGAQAGSMRKFFFLRDRCILVQFISESTAQGI